MRRNILIMTVSLLATSASMAEPNDGGTTGGLFQRVWNVFERVRDIGPWEQQHGDVMVAVENVFTLNNWDSEADQFSIDLIREVGSIPPWQAEERIDTLVDMLGDRYDFDERQSRIARNTIIRESNKMFFRHAPNALAYSMEIVETRAAGEPFTSDQVARWTEMAMPVFIDAHANMQQAVEKFLPELNEEQKALVLEDMAANDRRFNVVKQGAEQWKNGEWDATAWGLQDDPIQMSEVWAREDAAAEAKAQRRESAESMTREEAEKLYNTPQNQQPVQVERNEPVASRSNSRGRQPQNQRRTRQVEQRPAKSNDPWEKHVRTFIDQYKLIESQQTTAWRIYRDLSQRRDILRDRNARRLASVESQLAQQPERLAKQVETITSQGDKQVDVLFSQLNQRLERLPTRAQRQAAAAAKPAKKKAAKTPKE